MRSGSTQTFAGGRGGQSPPAEARSAPLPPTAQVNAHLRGEASASSQELADAPDGMGDDLPVARLKRRIEQLGGEDVEP